MLEELPDSALAKINRSQAVNPKHITRLSTDKLYIGGIQFQISPSYKK